MADDRPLTPAERAAAEARREAEEAKAKRLASERRILKAVKRQGYWWPGDDAQD